MERELFFCSDNACLCNNSTAQGHWRKCFFFLSADWSQPRWEKSTRFSQNGAGLRRLCSGPRCLIFFLWWRAASPGPQLSRHAQKGKEGTTWKLPWVVKNRNKKYMKTDFHVTPHSQLGVAVEASMTKCIVFMRNLDMQRWKKKDFSIEMLYISGKI